VSGGKEGKKADPLTVGIGGRGISERRGGSRKRQFE